MTRVLPRTSFHSSRLVRVLADLSALKAMPPGHALAEQLALWVNYTDAITLCAVHNAQPAGLAALATLPGQAVAQDASDAKDVCAAFESLQSDLERAITRSKLPPLDVHALSNGTAREISAAYEPFRRYYQTQQRDMQLAIALLRNKVREALACSTAALRQLAALDAALEGILRERESRLLASVPQLLMRRFVEMVQKAPKLPHLPAPQALQAAAAQARFGTEMQTVLLAELELRLQTTRGLVEALHQEKIAIP